MARPKESYRGYRRNHARFLKLLWSEYQRMWPLRMLWQRPKRIPKSFGEAAEDFANELRR